MYTISELRDKARIAAKIDKKIEELQDQKQTLTQELEHRAYALAKAKGGIISRTTEHLVFDGVSSKDPNLATFDTYDRYDGEWTSSCSFTFDQLADFENEAIRLAAQKKDNGLRQAERDLEFARERVTRLGGKA